MNNNPFDNYKGTSDSAVRGGMRELPMNWYKFLILYILASGLPCCYLFVFSKILIVKNDPQQLLPCDELDQNEKSAVPLT